ncbi:MAG: phosphoglycolate phosphatase [Magnetococcales bacterium]|nr:phosphoglycolate phosphatase [Magnetococcales bacterium]
MSATLPCRSVLFDLDGTLVDSAPDLWHTLNHTLQQMGRPPLALEEVRHLVGNGARFLLARGLYGPQAEAPQNSETFEEAVRLFLAYYQDHLTDNSHPYPGCIPMLQQLTDRGFGLAVVTNKPEKMARKMLSNLKMTSFFKQIFGGDSLPERKPHPLPLLHTLEQLATPPSLGVMVGDSETDSLAARGAGCRLILVTHGYNRGVPVQQLKPDRTIDTLEALVPLLTLV